MMDVVDKIARIAERLNPDQVEAYWSKNRIITIRIALNQIAEAKTMTVEGASVRLVTNKSVGFASSTDLSADGIAKMVEASHKAAKSKSADPDFRSLPEPSKSSLSPVYDKTLVNVDLSEVVGLGYDALRVVRDEGRGLDLSGTVNAVSEECKVTNSLGVNASDMSAFVYSSFTVEENEERSSIGQDCSRTLGDFNPARTVREAIESVRRDKGGMMIKPGTYDVILGPHACAELIEYVLTYAIDLSAVDSGMSYLRGRLGETIGSREFSVLDDGHHPDGIASKTVDDEGISTGTTHLIENGVLRGFLSDSYYAAKMSSPLRVFNSTGNGFRFGPVPGRDHSSIPRIQPTNIIICPGKQSLEELIEETRRGIIIGRIWYSYPINPTMGEFSTTNRGDTHYIENGRLEAPILPNSFRINDELPRLLKQIKGITKEQTQSIVWGGVSSCFSPHIKFGDVRITYSKV